jgi:hypothetical protein
MEVHGLKNNFTGREKGLDYENEKDTGLRKKDTSITLVG